MAENTFSREQVEALEKILGIKLPEGGFTLEIKPIGGEELSEGQLENVAGGFGTQTAGVPSLPAVQRFSCKI